MSVEVNNESGYDVDEAEFAALARYVLDEMHVHPQTDLSILLVGTDVMTDLHVKWMDEPGPRARRGRVEDVPQAQLQRPGARRDHRRGEEVGGRHGRRHR